MVSYPSIKPYICAQEFIAKVVVKSHLTSAFTERKKQPTPVKEIERKDEEEWSLKDVVFVEDSKTLPVGKVIKVKNFFG